MIQLFVFQRGSGVRLRICRFVGVFRVEGLEHDGLGGPRMNQKAWDPGLEGFKLGFEVGCAPNPELFLGATTL